MQSSEEGTRIHQWTAAALLLGSSLFVVHLVARSFITAGTGLATAARGSAWMPVHALGCIGALLVLAGLPALYRRIEETGWLPLLGLALIGLNWCFVGVFLSFLSVLVVPWLAEKAPFLLSGEAAQPRALIVTFLLGLAAQLVGTGLLAAPYLRGDVTPRWAGVLLPASAILGIVGDLVAPSGPSSNLALNLFSNLGTILFVVVLADQGLRALTASSGPRSEAPTVHPR